VSELLNFNELQDLIKAALQADLYESDKRVLLFSRFRDLRAKVHKGSSDEIQLRLDLQYLNNSAPRDGLHPLLAWLQNARSLVAGTTEQDYFESLVQRLEQTAGTPGVPADIVAAVQNEAILFEDDMLPVGYLQAGLLAGQAVARLQTTRYDDGVESSRKYWGTGWLLTESLLITNHHVFNARNDGEPPAKQSDFDLQAKATALEFDADGQTSATNAGLVTEIVCADRELDYALARIPAQSGRRCLRLEKAPLTIKPDDVVPLNIIQHPNGLPKKIAIRNNLARAAPAGQIRYFTSTLGGSSGSPVLNDQWKVVGLHRGSIGTKVQNFQGRTTAIINLGTQITSILAHMPAAVRQEIDQAQQ
jgi:hypothetical protein